MTTTYKPARGSVGRAFLSARNDEGDYLNQPSHLPYHHLPEEEEDPHRCLYCQALFMDEDELDMHLIQCAHQKRHGNWDNGEKKEKENIGLDRAQEGEKHRWETSERQEENRLDGDDDDEEKMQIEEEGGLSTIPSGSPLVTASSPCPSVLMKTTPVDGSPSHLKSHFSTPTMIHKNPSRKMSHSSLYSSNTNLPEEEEHTRTFTPPYQHSSRTSSRSSFSYNSPTMESKINMLQRTPPIRKGGGRGVSGVGRALEYHSNSDSIPALYSSSFSMDNREDEEGTIPRPGIHWEEEGEDEDLANGKSNSFSGYQQEVKTAMRSSYTSSPLPYAKRREPRPHPTDVVSYPLSQRPHPVPASRSPSGVPRQHFSLASSVSSRHAVHQGRDGEDRDAGEGYAQDRWQHSQEDLSRGEEGEEQRGYEWQSDAQEEEFLHEYSTNNMTYPPRRSGVSRAAPQRGGVRLLEEKEKGGDAIRDEDSSAWAVALPGSPSYKWGKAFHDLEAMQAENRSRLERASQGWRRKSQPYVLRIAAPPSNTATTATVSSPPPMYSLSSSWGAPGRRSTSPSMGAGGSEGNATAVSSSHPRFPPATGGGPTSSFSSFSFPSLPSDTPEKVQESPPSWAAPPLSQPADEGGAPPPVTSPIPLHATPTNRKPITKKNALTNSTTTPNRPSKYTANGYSRCTKKSHVPGVKEEEASKGMASGDVTTKDAEGRVAVALYSIDEEGEEGAVPVKQGFPLTSPSSPPTAMAAAFHSTASSEGAPSCFWSANRSHRRHSPPRHGGGSPSAGKEEDREAEWNAMRGNIHDAGVAPPLPSTSTPSVAGDAVAECEKEGPLPIQCGDQPPGVHPLPAAVLKDPLSPRSSSSSSASPPSLSATPTGGGKRRMETAGRVHSSRPPAPPLDGLLTLSEEVQGEMPEPKEMRSRGVSRDDRRSPSLQDPVMRATVTFPIASFSLFATATQGLAVREKSASATRLTTPPHPNATLGTSRTPSAGAATDGAERPTSAPIERSTNSAIRLIKSKASQTSGRTRAPPSTTPTPSVSLARDGKAKAEESKTAKIAKGKETASPLPKAVEGEKDEKKKEEGTTGAFLFSEVFHLESRPPLRFGCRSGSGGMEERTEDGDSRKPRGDPPALPPSSSSLSSSPSPPHASVSTDGSKGKAKENTAKKGAGVGGKSTGLTGGADKHGTGKDGPSKSGSSGGGGGALGSSGTLSASSSSSLFPRPKKGEGPKSGPGGPTVGARSSTASPNPSTVPLSRAKATTTTTATPATPNHRLRTVKTAAGGPSAVLVKKTPPQGNKGTHPPTASHPSPSMLIPAEKAPPMIPAADVRAAEKDMAHKDVVAPVKEPEIALSPSSMMEKEIPHVVSRTAGGTHAKGPPPLPQAATTNTSRKMKKKEEEDRVRLSFGRATGASLAGTTRTIEGRGGSRSSSFSRSGSRSGSMGGEGTTQVIPSETSVPSNATTNQQSSTGWTGGIASHRCIKSNAHPFSASTTSRGRQDIHTSGGAAKSRSTSTQSEEGDLHSQVSPLHPEKPSASFHLQQDGLSSPAESPVAATVPPEAKEMERGGGGGRTRGGPYPRRGRVSGELPFSFPSSSSTAIETPSKGEGTTRKAQPGTSTRPREGGASSTLSASSPSVTALGVSGRGVGGMGGGGYAGTSQGRVRGAPAAAPLEKDEEGRRVAGGVRLGGKEVVSGRFPLHPSKTAVSTTRGQAKRDAMASAASGYANAFSSALELSSSSTEVETTRPHGTGRGGAGMTSTTTPSGTATPTTSVRRGTGGRGGVEGMERGGTSSRVLLASSPGTATHLVSPSTRGGDGRTFIGSLPSSSNPSKPSPAATNTSHTTAEPSSRLMHAHPSVGSTRPPPNGGCPIAAPAGGKKTELLARTEKEEDHVGVNGKKKSGGIQASSSRYPAAAAEGGAAHRGAGRTSTTLPLHKEEGTLRPKEAPVERMGFCTSCGKAFPDDEANFCGYCGNRRK